MSIVMAIVGVEKGNLARDYFLELLEIKSRVEHHAKKEDTNDMSKVLVSVFLEAFEWASKAWTLLLMFVDLRALFSRSTYLHLQRLPTNVCGYELFRLAHAMGYLAFLDYYHLDLTSFN